MTFLPSSGIEKKKKKNNKQKTKSIEVKTLTTNYEFNYSIIVFSRIRAACQSTCVLFSVCGAYLLLSIIYSIFSSFCFDNFANEYVSVSNLTENQKFRIPTWCLTYACSEDRWKLVSFSFFDCKVKRQSDILVTHFIDIQLNTNDQIKILNECRSIEPFYFSSFFLFYVFVWSVCSYFFDYFSCCCVNCRSWVGIKSKSVSFFIKVVYFRIGFCTQTQTHTWKKNPRFLNNVYIENQQTSSMWRPLCVSVWKIRDFNKFKHQICKSDKNQNKQEKRKRCEIFFFSNDVVVRVSEPALLIFSWPSILKPLNNIHTLLLLSFFFFSFSSLCFFLISNS